MAYPRVFNKAYKSKLWFFLKQMGFLLKILVGESLLKVYLTKPNSSLIILALVFFFNQLSFILHILLL